MRKLSKSTKIIATVAAAAAVIAGSGAAYAYWTTTGTGSGTVSTAASALPVTVVQTSTINTLAPGVAAQTLSGNFNNTTPGPLYVTTVTAAITAVSGTCIGSDFTLSNAAMAYGHEVPVGTGVGTTWTGATIAFNDKVTNQDMCKGATVTIGYTAS